MSKIEFLNIKVDNLTMDEAINSIDELINNGKYNYVVTPNLDHIVQLEVDDEFKEIYNNADLVLTDGMPLIWISKFMKRPIKEKISGSDLFPKVCKLANDNGYTMFLLGAAEGVAAEASRRIKHKNHKINIVGTYSPSYGFEKNILEVEKIINIINNARPDILAVGLGAPKQEKFIYRYKEHLKVPVSLGIGASIDFEAGEIKRAPVWMQKSGLEWFYRMMCEPKRLFKRYFNDGIKIFGIVMKYKKLGSSYGRE